MIQKLETIEKTNFDGGNTITPSKNPKIKTIQVVQAKLWCFTLNNYLETDIEELKNKFNTICSKWIIGKEVGEQGTPHLQGFCYFLKKLRPLELKLNPKIHWEKCKGTEQDNIIYCSKENNFIKSNNCIVPKPLKIIKDLKPWQSDLEKLLLEEPEDRKIIWVYENIGKVGKSAFSKYLINTYDSLYITEGKKTDIINMVYNYVLCKELNIVILDVPRDNKNKISYKSLEEIKNGIICNTKYETGCKVINPPHIIVFSNYPPETERLSLDRWDIYEISNNILVKQDGMANANNEDIFDEIDNF